MCFIKYRVEREAFVGKYVGLFPSSDVCQSAVPTGSFCLAVPIMLSHNGPLLFSVQGVNEQVYIMLNVSAQKAVMHAS